MTEKPVPILQALVLADHVYRDQPTGKFIIAGTFNRLWAKEFPSTFGATTWAYVCLTELPTPAELQLRYVDLSDNQVLLETQPLHVTAQDPLQSVELVFAIPPLPMPHEGVYAFEVASGSTLLGFKRVHVTKIPAQNKGES